MTAPPPPFQVVPVPPTGARNLSADPPRRIFVYTVHDGDHLPEEFLTPSIDRGELERRRIAMRDWGANRVARHLAGALGIGRYGRANVARVLLDLNRFPGTSARTATNPLDRLAIMEPFGSTLRHAEKMAVLRIYDGMSTAVESQIDGSLISIGIHTYDVLNPSATKRPDVSIISTPNTYLHHSRMPDGLFDPAYPDLLAESTCSRVLRDRISLTLERNGFRVSQNHPYPLPEGSIEVRAQVWSFFRFVRERFERAFPNRVDDPGARLVWSMLLDTNLRDARAEALRGYLHRYHRPSSPEQRATFQDAREAYSRIRAFIEESDVIAEYRGAPDRPSTLAIEVRKDLLVTFDDDGRPLPCSEEQDSLAARVAEVIADAIQTFLDTDRPTERGQPRD